MPARIAPLPDANGERAERSTRRALAGFLFGTTGMFATMYATQPILPELARHFDTSEASAGLTISVVLVAIAVGSFLWGPLSDRIGRSRSLLLASALLVVPTVGTALAPTFETLLAARALQGLCMPGLLTVGIPYAMEEFGERIGARVMGYYTCALIVGSLVGRVGVALVTSVAGWRVGLGLLAALPIAATIILRRVLPKETVRRTRHTPARGAVLRTVTNPRLLLATVIAATGNFAFQGTFSYIGFRLEAPPFFYGQVVTGLVFCLWALGFTAPLAGRLVERIGWRRVVVLAVAIGLPGILLTLVDSIAVFVLGLALLAIGGFAIAPATQIGVAESTDVDRGLASAVFYGIYYTCTSLAAYLPGIAWEHAGWSGVVGATAGTFAVGFAVFAAGMWRTAPDSVPRPRSAPSG